MSQVQRRSVIRDRDFRRLWGAETVSVFGSEIGELALPLLAIGSLGATGQEVGWLRAALFAPFLLATIPVGVVADRVRRRRLMIGADLARFATVGTIPVAIWIGVDRVWPLLPLVFLVGVGAVVFETATYAYLPSLVDVDRLVEANTWRSSSQSAAQIGGKGFGGLLVAVATAPIAIVVNAAAHMFSVLQLLNIRSSEPPPQSDCQGSQSHPLAGLVELFRHPILRPLVAEATTYNLFNEAFVTAMLIYTARTAGLSPAAIGVVFTLGALGGVLGAALGHRISTRFNFGRGLIGTIAIGNTASVIAWAATPTPAIAFAALGTALLLMGFGSGMANVHTVSLRQVSVPNSRQARLNAAYRLVSWGAIPVGAALGGVLTAWLGARVTMNLAAAGIPLATVWLLGPSIRQLTTLPRPHGE